MPGIDYRAARAALPLAAVLELIGYQPRSRRGDQLRGPCPLHGSRSRTSRVFAAPLGKNSYHCFRCGAGGNALDLWAALTGQALHAAVLDLCQRLGQPVPWLPPRRPARPAAPAQLPAATNQENTTRPAP
jgi:DNA primase